MTKKKVAPKRPTQPQISAACTSDVPSTSGTYASSSSRAALFESVEKADVIGESPTKRRRVPEAEASVISVSVELYSKKASLFDSRLGSTCLYQVQVEHAARPSMLFRFRQSFTRFLTLQHAENSEFASNWSDFLIQYNCLFVQNGSEVQKNSGQIPWAKAFYVGGTEKDVQLLLECLDSFFQWRLTSPEDEFPSEMQVKMNDCTSLNLELDADNMEMHWEVSKGSALSSKPQQVAPPTTRKEMPKVHVETVGPGMLFMLFTGDTWTYRDGFADFSIPGRYLDAAGCPVDTQDLDASEKRKLCFARVLRDVDVNDATVRQAILRYFTDTVFHGSLVGLEIAGDMSDDSVAQDFISNVKKLPNVIQLNA
mmetsp:Transcript_23916/g.59595  ORF Transcript_23916/g.59595 Transcript_23916/m.59595 type:complete len:368 (-) Transcript_23916:202-1305(-)